MLMDQRWFRPKASVSDANGQGPLPTSAEFVRSCNAQAHEMVDALTATVANAEAGLSWLCAESLDLGEVQQALNNIARDGKRAGEMVVRLRALINEGADNGLCF